MRAWRSAETFGNCVAGRGVWLGVRRHVSPLDETETDFVASRANGLSARLICWGGRESAGIDCSGLVQVSLQASRDTSAA